MFKIKQVFPKYIKLSLLLTMTLSSIATMARADDFSLRFGIGSNGVAVRDRPDEWREHQWTEHQWREQQWREQQWREQQWREHQWREQQFWRWRQHQLREQYEGARYNEGRF